MNFEQVKMLIAIVFKELELIKNKGDLSNPYTQEKIDNFEEIIQFLGLLYEIEKP